MNIKNRKCVICGKKHIARGLCHKHWKQWRKGKLFDIPVDRYGENNSHWKGDKAGYHAMHKWIYNQKGKPKICVDCGATCKERRLYWSNIDHKYRRNLNDYISRCSPCHNKYDIKFLNKKNGRKFVYKMHRKYKLKKRLQ